MGKQITKDMMIQEIIHNHPETIKVFKAHNLDCMNCQIAEFEEICHGAAVHHINPVILLAELNSVVRGIEKGNA